MRPLPRSMMLGVASSAFQVEGACNSADKSASIWDTYCAIHSQTDDNINPSDACKSYEYYKRDVAMVKFLGMDFYRFSISWPRVLPSGHADKISKEGSQYYSNLIDELIANGIEPVATMYHWDLPQSLQDLGGWANPLIVQWFEDYARVLFELYGDRVKTWVTLNEPKQFGLYGYGNKMLAPGVNRHGIAEYIVMKNMLLAHARAWHVYDEEYRFRQKGTIGITIATDYCQGMTDDPDDVQAGSEAMEFEVGIYSHPIYSTKGGFPDAVVKLVGEKSRQQGFPRSRLPEFSEEEREYVKGTSDFFGFNHYSTRFYTRKTYEEGTYPVPSYDDDLGANWSYMDYKPGLIPHCTSIPHGIRKALNWVRDNCNDPPIMILENGCASETGLHDEERIGYLNDYMDSLLDAVEVDGCNVVSYTVWTIMDNFEWSLGLSVRFGIFEVDFEDEKKTRKPRKSAFWLRELAKQRALQPNHSPIVEEIEF